MKVYSLSLWAFILFSLCSSFFFPFCFFLLRFLYLDAQGYTRVVHRIELSHRTKLDLCPGVGISIPHLFQRGPCLTVSEESGIQSTCRGKILNLDVIHCITKILRFHTTKFNQGSLSFRNETNKIYLSKIQKLLRVQIFL